MERKAEQGSIQLQGEVQEIAIENILKELFPDDEIKEVSKGTRGADVIQILRNRKGMNCGKIIYESKRTKSFSNTWLEKLKKDQRQEKADVAVIITQEMPKDTDVIDFQGGIWICNFQTFKGLAIALRESLIKIDFIKESQKNKGDKMNMLYNYLTSNEFKLQIEAIIEGFTNMRNSIQKEKLAMEKIWKEREKQIEKVLINTTQFFGSVKGIAGKSIPEVKTLELSETV